MKARHRRRRPAPTSGIKNNRSSHEALHRDTTGAQPESMVDRAAREQRHLGPPLGPRSESAERHRRTPSPAAQSHGNPALCASRAATAGIRRKRVRQLDAVSSWMPARPVPWFWRISGLSRGVLEVLLRCWHGYVAPERTPPHAARPSPLVVGGRASPGRSTHRSRTQLVRRLQRQQLDGQRRSRRALLRPAKRASPRRRRPACSRSSDSGVFSASAAMPAPRAKPGRAGHDRGAGHDVSASLAATGSSTVVLKPFLSLAVR